MATARTPQLSAQWMLDNGYVPHDAQGNLLSSWDSNVASRQDYGEATGSGENAMVGEPVVGSGQKRYDAAVAELQALIDSGRVSGVTAFNPSGREGGVNVFNRYTVGQDGALAAADPLKQYEGGWWAGTGGARKPTIAAALLAAGAGGLNAAFGGAAAGAGGAAAGTQALTPALMESMIGTAGYGASSAGAGGGALGLGGLASYAADAAPALASAAGPAATTTGVGKAGGTIANLINGMTPAQMVGAGLSAVGTVGGLVQGNKAADLASNAQTSAERTAQSQLDLSREALQFYKDQFAQGEGARQRAEAEAILTSQQGREIAAENLRQLRDRNAYETGTFRPLEQRLVREAGEYDTPERRNSAALAAAAGVGQAFRNTREAQTMRNATMGVMPGSGRAQEMDARLGVDEAALTAGAMNTARDRVETQGYARMADAANMGRNLPSQQATNSQLALSGANTATNAAIAPVSVNQSAAASMQPGFATAINANQGAGSLMQGALANRQQQAASTAAGWGQLAGVGANLLLSDVAKKTGISAISDDDALAAIDATPVTKWQYKDGAEGAPQDGMTRVGPMAQDVNATMGEEAAPGGVAIDPVTVQGVALKGIQAVNKKVDQLAATIAQMAQRGIPQMGVA